MHIIGGKYKNSKLLSPKGMNTRPTSSRLRESVFNICQHLIEGADVLDLFAGSGAIGIEALSRGGNHVVFVDKSRDSIACIRKNLHNLRIETGVEIYCADVFKILKKLSEQERQFDLIYLDPPYTQQVEGEKKGTAQLILEELDQLNLLAPGGRLFIEEAQKALQANVELATLTLKDERNDGRSSLYQYMPRGA